MKPSKYNYIVPFGEKFIFFNGITEAFFMVSAEHLESYKTILANPNENGEAFAPFLERMRAQGFVTSDDVNEMDLIKQKFEAARHPHRYFMMVLPTYQCNLRCWYCIQEHENLFMTDETVKRVKERISLKLSNGTINELHLSWFGGEPLMAYEQVLDITRFARSLAEEHGKRFSCGITTNATLLTPGRIDALHDAGVVSYQITIDGDRETHNSIKRLNGVSAYDRVMDNINLIARHTHVTLRFNYTRENLRPREIAASLKSRLDPDVTSNISFSMYMVWQENGQDIDFNDVDLLFELGKEMGMSSNLLTTGLCYADGVHYDCVFPNGRVGKCDNHSPHDMSGELQPDGTILWDKDMTEYYTPHLFDSKQIECQSCGYLPVCWGPCVAKRENMLRNGGMILCAYQDRDAHMRRIISNTCKTILQRTR